MGSAETCDHRSVDPFNQEVPLLRTKSQPVLGPMGRKNVSLNDKVSARESHGREEQTDPKNLPSLQSEGSEARLGWQIYQGRRRSWIRFDRRQSTPIEET
jgi:hypothetical protein